MFFGGIFAGARAGVFRVAGWGARKLGAFPAVKQSAGSGCLGEIGIRGMQIYFARGGYIDFEAFIENDDLLGEAMLVPELVGGERLDDMRDYVVIDDYAGRECGDGDVFFFQVGVNRGVAGYWSG